MTLVLFVVAVIAGGAAAVVGFGIGSLLTPLVAASVGTEAAIALVAVPHAVATTVRAWRLRSHVDWPTLWRFGLLSAVGGLAGAALYASVGGGVLTVVLALLLLLTAVAGVTGWTDRWTPRGPVVWLLGLLSGLFGGVAGNQGGLRAAALGTFALAPAAFVATSTAIGVLVDAARTPIYLLRAGDTIRDHASLVAVLVAGVLIGTFAGEHVLLSLPRARFRMVLALAIGVLGLWLLGGVRR